MVVIWCSVNGFFLGVYNLRFKCKWDQRCCDRILSSSSTTPQLVEESSTWKPTMASLNWCMSLCFRIDEESSFPTINPRVLPYWDHKNQTTLHWKPKIRSPAVTSQVPLLLLCSHRQASTWINYDALKENDSGNCLHASVLDSDKINNGNEHQDCPEKVNTDCTSSQFTSSRRRLGCWRQSSNENVCELILFRLVGH